MGARKGGGEGPQAVGGGVGGGVEVKPVRIIEVTAADTRFISFGERRRIVRASILGLLAAIFLLRRRGEAEPSGALWDEGSAVFRLSPESLTSG